MTAMDADLLGADYVPPPAADALLPDRLYSGETSSREALRGVQDVLIDTLAFG